MIASALWARFDGIAELPAGCLCHRERVQDPRVAVLRQLRGTAGMLQGSLGIDNFGVRPCGQKPGQVIVGRGQVVIEFQGRSVVLQRRLETAEATRAFA